MIDLRLMVRFNDKNNIKRVQCSKKDDALLNIITDDYVPIEIIYVNYIDLYNRKNEDCIYWNVEFDLFNEMLKKYKNLGIIEFNELIL